MNRDIRKEIVKRVLVLDGAMGTMIQGYGLDEAAFRGTRFRSWEIPLKGNNDLLCLSQPQIIREIHEEYLIAGADIIETNTFNSNRISLQDYRMESLVYEINLNAAKIAAEVAASYSLHTPGKPRFVAGSIGPTNKTASMSPDVNDPGYRAVTFDDLVIAYKEQITGLIDGGVDLLLIETVFDTLNAKAALMAANELLRRRNLHLPVMISGTIADASGRTLSGQTLEAFLISVSHAGLFSIGLNCSLGARELRPFLEELSDRAPCYVSAHPNAGLPNQFGQYDETPALMATLVKDFLDSRFVNIIGGCCGTTPDHIRQLAALAATAEPRTLPVTVPTLTLSGLEPLRVFPGSNFINIGERTNVSGSKQFARLIREGDFEKTLTVARHQVENGAQIIDVNMDDAMLDGVSNMTRFLNLLGSEPAIARVPVMIDSSDWKVLEAGLKCIQGKAVVNSVSLKEGEQVFLERVRKIRDYGAAAVVMAFDEEGQATTFDRRTEICKRAYNLLTGEIGFPPEDIVFDPNVLAIATGMKEHNGYAVDFIRTVKWIKENLPYSSVSGGISNLSFSFRGNDRIREAIHSVFLFHAVNAGLDMGIVNAGNLPLYDDIPADLRQLAEDLVLNRRKDATERMLQFAGSLKETEKETIGPEAWRQENLPERLKHALVHGVTDYIEQDIDDALAAYDKAIDIIEGPLMDGMGVVGDRFGSGKMFLPQVIKSARVMKKAVARLMPVIEKQNAGQPGRRKSAGKVVLATVKGDVHDIGKNIVGVVMGCNNYEVIDLGVMVPAETILRTAVTEKADIIGLSGLITPSLEEMVHVGKEMQRTGLQIPLLIGGATTSEIHTAVRIDPHCSFPVVHVRDASKTAGVLSGLLSEEKKKNFRETVKQQYRQLRRQYEENKSDPAYIGLKEARDNRFRPNWNETHPFKPGVMGVTYFYDYPLEELREYIDWTFFFHGWKLNGKYPAILKDPVKGPEAVKLFNDAQRMLDRIIAQKMLLAKGAFGLYPCNSAGDDVEVYDPGDRKQSLTTLRFLRNQQKKERGEPNACLSDFILPKEKGINDYIGLFAVTAGLGLEEWVDHYNSEMDDYSSVMIRLLADRLAEAFAERLHERIRREFWGYAAEEEIGLKHLLKQEYRGIRPAPGYPACPDHSEKKVLFDLLDATRQINITLTENFAMYPAASVSGYLFAHPEASYFAVGKIGKDQATDYARRKNIALEVAEKLLTVSLNYK